MNKQQLVEDNMNLVYFLIRQYCPRYITDEDIIQCGMLGLCKAAETWDESRTLFSSYAGKCILYEIWGELERRKRHKGVLSLEYPIGMEDGEPEEFGSLIAGEEDIDFVDDESFYKQLSPDERCIVEYRQMGYTNKEIAAKMDCSEQSISEKVRKLRYLWRSINGD